MDTGIIFGQKLITSCLEKLLTVSGMESENAVITELNMMGFRNGMKSGWDVHTLNKEMIEMLKPDCEDTAKKIENNSFRRWKEEHKQELDWYCESLTEFAYLAVIYSLSISTGRTEAYKQEVRPVEEEAEGGSSTLNDWVNRIPELEKQAPIEIPSNATVKVQAKNGYDQISFKWTENGQNYEVRWHTKTPGAPEGQGNTWVVSRVTPGTPTGQVRTEHILVGDTWIPRYQWQDAINAYRNGTATQEQLQLLKDGHWQAP